MLARSNPQQKPDVVFPDVMELQFLVQGCWPVHISESYRLTHNCKIHEAARRKVTPEALTLERIKAVLTCTVHGNTLSGSGGGPHLFWSWSHWLWSGTAKQRVAVAPDVTLGVILKGDFRLNEDSCGGHEPILRALIIASGCRCLRDALMYKPAPMSDW